MLGTLAVPGQRYAGAVLPRVGRDSEGDGAVSVSEDLKEAIAQLIWGVFAIISALEGYVLLSGGQLSMGLANVLICLGLTALTVCWRRIVYYFASNPMVLRVGVLVILFILGIMYSPLLTSREFLQQKVEKAGQFSGIWVSFSIQKGKPKVWSKLRG